MGITAYPRKLPAPKQTVANDDGSITNDYRYLLLALYNATGQGDGVPNVQAGLAVVAGSIFNIVGDWNQFSSVGNGGAALLPSLVVGTDCIVWNDDGNGFVLTVKPQPSSQIDTLGLGNGYSLPAAKMQWFRQVTPTLIHSMQLG